MPFPKILVEYCKGCGLCVQACPTDVLEISEELGPLGVNPARPARPEDCTGCMACYTVCPDAAVEVYVERKRKAAKAEA